MRLFRQSFLPLLTSILASSALVDAQIVTDVRSPTWNKTYGNSAFGGNCSASAVMMRRYVTGQPALSNFVTSTNLKSDIAIFGSTTTIAMVDLQGNNAPYDFIGSGPFYTVNPIPGYQPMTNCLVQIKGVTRWAPGWFAASTFTKNWNMLVTDPNHTVGATYYLLGIPISVSAYVGPVANVGWVVNANTLNSSLGVNGFASVASGGGASCAVGWSWASAGIKGSLSFAAPKLEVSVNASTAAIAGTFRVTMNKINVFLEIWAKLFRRKASRTLVNWSIPAIDPVLVNF